MVPQAVLRITSEGVGQVIEDGTQAWVGTKLGPVAKPLWQVKLKKGEMVEVLGQVNWPHPEGHSTVWYQIAPPAGEFRWVRMSDIQLPLGSSIKSKPPTLTLDDVVTNSSIQRVNMKSEFNVPNTRQPEPYKAVSINEGWRQATKPIAPAKNNRRNGISDNDSSRQLSSFEGALAGMGEAPSAPNRPSRSATPLSNSGSVIRIADANMGTSKLARDLNSARSDSRQQFTPGSVRLADLEFKLTQEMLGDPAQWKLEDLEVTANSLFQKSPSETERRQVEKYLKKISNCKTIRSGYRNSGNASGGATFASANSATGRSQAIGSGVNQTQSSNANYDATGWLNEMVRQGGNTSSSFVLQDQTGKITHLVTPAPGQDLRRYLKRRIGIIGQLGFHTQLNLSHVTSMRVTLLDQ